MDNPFGPDALAQALHDSLPPVTEEQAHVGAEVRGKDVGVEGSVTRTFGKKGEGFVEAQGSWFTQAGYRLGVLVGWRKK